MIVTLTPNPSIDHTVEVARLQRGGVIRACGTRVDAGGKGVNVARALAANGHKALAVLSTGGAEGLRLESLLKNRAGLEIVMVPVRGAIRTNVTIVEPDGVTTKINTPGPVLNMLEVQALTDSVLTAAHGADWVVLCGSLPPGVPDGFYRDLIEPLSAIGAMVAVDTSGPALALALTAGPQLVKPNRGELAEAAGMPVRTLGDVVRAGQRLRAAGAGEVLASLGPDGALLVTGAGCWLATAPACEPRSTVGAGDALLAGYLCMAGGGPTALVEAVAYGTAAILLPGSRMPKPADIDSDAVQFHSTFDPDQRLSEG